MDAAAEEAQDALGEAEDLFLPSPFDLLEDEAGAGVPPADCASPPESYSPAECALAAEVSSDGYVTRPLPPWSGLERLGRLTDWPADKAPEDRSFSMKVLISREQLRSRAHAEEGQPRYDLAVAVQSPDSSRRRRQE